MRVFLDFPEVEDSMQESLRQIVREIMLTKAQNGGRPSVDVLTDLGAALEVCIGEEVSGCGYEWKKGAVVIVDDKEVDIAAPNLEEPSILIMSSYQLTTSSSQSSKANEQARMYQDVQTHNRRRRQLDRPGTLFVNVIDGGGWLSRPQDLRRMWQECDYCFSHATLGGLREVLAYCMET